MNLAIDVGNTFIKAGIFENGKLTSFHSGMMVEDLKSLAANVHPEHIIVSSVDQDPEEIFALFPGIRQKRTLSYSTSMPLKNLYKTPHTLGMDRIAGAVGGIALFPGENRLVIDAGTCITYDFTDEKDQYHGGAISPGIDIRFKALNTFTKKLPLVERSEISPLTGSDTKECILSGVQNGVIFEVKGIIDQYREKYPEIKIIICGGDSSFFESKIKQSIFAVPELVLIGLNRILEYNVSKV